MILGNDVSEFQGQIDFNTLKNNANFVIIRATVGTSRVDKQFFRNRDEARRVGLPLGFYHYSYPQFNSPQAEADYVCQQLADIRDGEIIVLDFEETWSGDNVAFCKSFLDRVANNLKGYKPLIYLNQNQLNTFNWKVVSNAGYGLWVAAYTYDPHKNAFVTGSWTFAAMQQWTNQQQVPGISGNVDGDVFFGDVAMFKKYGYQKPIPIDPCATQNQQIKDLQKQLSDLNVQLKATQDKLKKTKDLATQIGNV